MTALHVENKTDGARTKLGKFHDVAGQSNNEESKKWGVWGSNHGETARSGCSFFTLCLYLFPWSPYSAVRLLVHSKLFSPWFPGIHCRLRTMLYLTSTSDETVTAPQECSPFESWRLIVQSTGVGCWVTETLLKANWRDFMFQLEVIAFEASRGVLLMPRFAVDFRCSDLPKLNDRRLFLQVVIWRISRQVTVLTLQRMHGGRPSWQIPWWPARPAPPLKALELWR
jgi:hypothetical protein